MDLTIILSSIKPLMKREKICLINTKIQEGFNGQNNIKKQKKSIQRK